MSLTSNEKNLLIKIINLDELIDKKNTQNEIVKIKQTLSYNDYIKNKVLLQKYKIPELKSIAKQHKIPITGTKVVLIKRIEQHFIHIKKAIIIQRFFRGYIARLYISLRGPAVFKRNICVNETDGYTLEPLNEIPFERFYSYIDPKNFIYGFDIFSLLQIYKNNGKILNPYTRERFDNKIINKIICLGKVIQILQPDLYTEYHPPPPPKKPLQNQFFRNTSNHNEGLRTNHSRVYNQEQRALMIKLQEIKIRPIRTRINDLFLEIDLLGNYTQSFWFTQLEKGEYIRFFRLLNSFWNYRWQLSYETKISICQLYDPFTNINLPAPLFDLSLEQLQELCLNVMEDMIYCGIDTEFQKIGALHVLSILTIVSIPARNNMIWLYESLLY
jgi:hypothetical protein